jgi:MFS family permease
LNPATIYVLFCFLIRFAQATYVTTYIIYQRDIGLSVSSTALLEAAFSISFFLSEVPTGMLADGKSRAWSLRAGSIALGASVILFGFANGFWIALLSLIGIGIGNAFLSGAQQAWVVDALKRRGSDDVDRDIRLTFSRAAIWTPMAYLIGGALGAICHGFSTRLPWFISGFVCVVAFLLSICYMNHEGEPEHRVSEWVAFRKSLSVFRSTRSLQWSVACVMVAAFITPLQTYWAPFFEELSGKQLLSVIWVYSIFGAIFGGYLIRSKKITVTHETLSILIALLFSALPMLLLGQTGKWTPLLLVLLWRFGHGLHPELLNLFIQRRIGSSYRATFGSLQSFFGRSSNAVVLGAMWLMSRHEPFTNSTLNRVWVLNGSILLICIVLLFFLRPKKSLIVS